MNDLRRALLDILDDFTTGDPADDRVDYDRLELAQEIAAAFMNDLILALLDILDDFTTADDRVDYDRLELAQEIAAALWEKGYRTRKAFEDA